MHLGVGHEGRCSCKGIRGCKRMCRYGNFGGL